MKKLWLICLFAGLLGVSSAQTSTPNIGLTEIPHGYPNWDTLYNSALLTLDTAIGELQGSYRGAWSIATTYTRGQLVQYNNGLYQSTVNSNVGNTPVGATQWVLMVSWASSSLVSDLGFTPESLSNKGSPSGYAPLDSGSLVPLANLPSFPESKVTALTTDLSSKVPTSRTVNGHALTGNVTVSKTDVSLSSVTNDVQTKATVMPNTAPTNGQIPVGNGVSYAPVAVSGDATMDSTGAATVVGVNDAPIPVSAGMTGTDALGHVIEAAVTASTLPAICTVGDFWSGDPSGSTNAVAYGCVATNTWLPYAQTRQLNSYCNGVATSSATLTLPGLGGPYATSGCAATVTAGLGVRMGVAGTLLSLGVSCGTSGAVSGSGVFTVWIQPPGAGGVAAATSITKTYGTTAAGTFLVDAAHSASFNAGAIVSVRFTTASSETIGTCGVVVVYV